MLPIIAIDFDGVIHSYMTGWKGVGVISDPPVEGIREAFRELRRAGYEIHVYSSRCRCNTGSQAIRDYLDKHDIKVDAISITKPIAIVNIDDRAICFDGHPENLLDQVKAFKPWNRK